MQSRLLIFADAIRKLNRAEKEPEGTTSRIVRGPCRRQWPTSVPPTQGPHASLNYHVLPFAQWSWIMQRSSGKLLGL